MTTSGTDSFNLQLTEIVEDAFERCGLEMRTGYDLRTARRSLNLMTIEWANRGINLWTIEQGEIVLETGQTTFALPTDTIDLLDHVVRQNNGGPNQIDINITRISETGYSTIPNKLTQGRPIQVWINRQSGEENATTITLDGGISASDTTINLSTTVGLASVGYIKIGSELIFYGNASDGQLTQVARGQNNTTAAAQADGTAVYVPQLPAVTVWPTPDNSTSYQFVYWRLRRVQDAGAGMETADMNFRFLPALTAGLAYHIALKVPGGAERLPILKAQYDEAWQLAADEDREKAAIRFVPRQQYIGSTY